MPQIQRQDGGKFWACLLCDEMEVAIPMRHSSLMGIRIGSCDHGTTCLLQCTCPCPARRKQGVKKMTKRHDGTLQPIPALAARFLIDSNVKECFGKPSVRSQNQYSNMYCLRSVSVPGVYSERRLCICTDGAIHFTPSTCRSMDAIRFAQKIIVAHPSFARVNMINATCNTRSRRHRQLNL